MKVMFLDESGDHNLSLIDPSCPVFVLGGVITLQSYAEGEMTERVRTFKQKSIRTRRHLFCIRLISLEIKMASKGSRTLISENDFTRS